MALLDLQPVAQRGLLQDNPRVLQCYCDGGVLGRNPSPRGVYWSLLVLGRPPVIRVRDHNYHTNNDAEWLALRGTLQWAVERQFQGALVIYSDSRHIVDSFYQRKRILLERHLRLYYECKRLEAQLRFVAVKWVPRAVIFEKLGH